MVVVALCLASCAAATDDGDDSPAHGYGTGSHEASSTSHPDAGDEAPTQESLSLSSTEVSRAQLELGPTGLEAELVRDGLDSVYRAEALWGRSQTSPGEPVRLQKGSVVATSFTSTLDLGGADGGDIWAVSWQLVGPDGNGNWPGPPLALSVGNGQWRIGGGDGHPGGSRESYAEIGIPFQDGQTIDWVIEVTVEAEGGTVDVWADGEHVVRTWRPPGGTLYPEQPYVLMKTGLYTGGGEAGRSSRMTIADAVATVQTPPAR